MRSDGLYRFSRGPHIPYGQSTIRMTANKLFSFMMPCHRVNSLQKGEEFYYHISDKWFGN